MLLEILHKSKEHVIPKNIIEIIVNETPLLKKMNDFLFAVEVKYISTGKFFKNFCHQKNRYND